MYKWLQIGGHGGINDQPNSFFVELDQEKER